MLHSVTIDPMNDVGPRTWIHVGFLKSPEGIVVSPTTIPTTETTADVYPKNHGIFSSMYDSVASWIGKKVMATMKYRHCEIAFEVDARLFTSEQLRPVRGIPYNDNTLVAYGTNLKVQHIFRMPRTFEQHKPDSESPVDRLKHDRSYEWIHLNVPISLAFRVIDFCEGELGKGYDKAALERLMVLPKRLESDASAWSTTQKWHCTNFCVVALQQAGFLMGLDPNVLTADDVYSFLEGNEFRKLSYRTPICMRKTRISDRIRNTSMIEQQYS